VFCSTVEISCKPVRCPHSHLAASHSVGFQTNHSCHINVTKRNNQLSNRRTLHNTWQCVLSEVRNSSVSVVTRSTNQSQLHCGAAGRPAGQTAAVCVATVTSCEDITMIPSFVLSEMYLHFVPLTVPSTFPGKLAWSHRTPFGVVISVCPSVSLQQHDCHRTDFG